MPYGLSQTVYNKLLNVFKTTPAIDEAVLFGSRAKGTFKTGSDIDIALKGKKLDTILLRKIEMSIEDLVLPYHVDLILFNQIQEPNLIEHINRAGICIYKNDFISSI